MVRFCTVVSFCYLFFLSGSLFSQNDVLTQDIIPDFDRHIQEVLESSGAPGLAAVVVRPQAILFAKGYGVTQIGTQDPVTLNTVFRLASVSKPFAAVLTGVLKEKGYLRWDDGVIRYVPWFTLKDSASTRALTLRHLLSHTTGVVSHAYTNLLQDDVPLNQIFSACRNLESLAPPGERYGYQNVIFSLIQPVLESVMSRSFSTLMEEEIFDALNMPDASVGRDALMNSVSWARPHVRDGWGFQTVPVKTSFYRAAPAAGVNASILDMGIWLRAMMGAFPRVIPLELIEEMTRAQALSPQEFRRACWRDHLKTAWYGLGWRIYDYNDMRIIYHSGWVQGYRSEVAWVPEKRVGVAVLMNAQGRFSDEFLPWFINRLAETDNRAVKMPTPEGLGESVAHQMP